MGLQKVVYVAMPKLLKGNETHKFTFAKNTLISNYPKYKNHYYFNPFKEINQDGDETLIMSNCFKKVDNSDAVLYIVPLPSLIDFTITLGAISEVDRALNNGKPVFVCTIGRNKNELFKINHIDKLMKKFDLRVPSWWSELRELNISRKFMENY